MSSMAARIDKLQSQYKSLGEKFEEAAKTYRSMLKHPSIDTQFKSIANHSASFKHDLDEIGCADLSLKIGQHGNRDQGIDARTGQLAALNRPAFPDRRSTGLH